MILRSTALALVLALAASPAPAQVSPNPTPPATPAPTEPRETIEGTLSQDRAVIAVPALATPAVTTVAGLRTDTLGRQIAEVIAADLERSGLYAPLGPGSVRAITMAEVTAPRINAPTPFIRACRAKRPSLTAGSLTSPRAAPRGIASSGSRSWTATAATTASSPTARR